MDTYYNAAQQKWTLMSDISSSCMFVFHVSHVFFVSGGRLELAICGHAWMRMRSCEHHLHSHTLTVGVSMSHSVCVVFVSDTQSYIDSGSQYEPQCMCGLRQ